jgi:hypothetical protein
VNIAKLAELLKNKQKGRLAAALHVLLFVLLFRRSLECGDAVPRT